MIAAPIFLVRRASSRPMLVAETRARSPDAHYDLRRLTRLGDAATAAVVSSGRSLTDLIT
jgi:hypothetical protein